jgi:hypothetical protein
MIFLYFIVSVSNKSNKYSVLDALLLPLSITSFIWPGTYLLLHGNKFTTLRYLSLRLSLNDLAVLKEVPAKDVPKITITK